MTSLGLKLIRANQPQISGKQLEAAKHCEIEQRKSGGRAGIKALVIDWKVNKLFRTGKRITRDAVALSSFSYTVTRGLFNKTQLFENEKATEYSQLKFLHRSEYEHMHICI